MSNIKGNRVLLLFSIKALLSSVISVFALNALFSFVILKLDLGDKIYSYFSVIIIFVASFITAYISTNSLRNNHLPFAIISIIPLITLSVVNCCFNKEILLFVIKIALAFVSCILVTLIHNKKKGRVRI